MNVDVLSLGFADSFCSLVDVVVVEVEDFEPSSGLNKNGAVEVVVVEAVVDGALVETNEPRFIGVIG